MCVCERVRESGGGRVIVAGGAGGVQGQQHAVVEAALGPPALQGSGAPVPAGAGGPQ